MKSEVFRQDMKHKKQWDELKSVNIANEKELEQIQVPVTACFHTTNVACLTGALHSYIHLQIMENLFNKK